MMNTDPNLGKLALAITCLSTAETANTFPFYVTGLHGGSERIEDEDELVRFKRDCCTAISICLGFEVSRMRRPSILERLRSSARAAAAAWRS